MRRVGWAVLIGLCCAPLWAAVPEVFTHPKAADELAASLLAEPAKEIAKAQLLRGKFTHKKYLAEIPAPLEASGEFVFIRDKGLYWHTQKPFESVFVLTPTQMIQQDEGRTSLRLNASDQPAVRAAARIFMSLFAVDLKSLADDFALFGMPNGSGWLLGLRPKNSAMSAVFTQAVVTGAAQVQQIELQDAHGDRTVIQLAGAELLARQPTAQERALVAP